MNFSAVESLVNWLAVGVQVVSSAATMDISAYVMQSVSQTSQSGPCVHKLLHHPGPCLAFACRHRRINPGVRAVAGRGDCEVWRILYKNLESSHPRRFRGLFQINVTTEWAPWDCLYWKTGSVHGWLAHFYGLANSIVRHYSLVIVHHSLPAFYLRHSLIIVKNSIPVSHYVVAPSQLPNRAAVICNIPTEQPYSPASQ